MATRNIFIEGEPVLRKKAKTVEVIDEKISTLIDDMIETMNQEDGVGIAAPQVGILKRVVVLTPDVEDPTNVMEFINPEITEEEGVQSTKEGCLSLPGFFGTVERPEKIRITGLDRNGEKQDYSFQGFAAVVACHEVDHLDGILYKDKATDYHKSEEE